MKNVKSVKGCTKLDKIKTEVETGKLSTNKGAHCVKLSLETVFGTTDTP
jgi:hypothetical protein